MSVESSPAPTVDPVLSPAIDTGADPLVSTPVIEAVNSVVLVGMIAEPGESRQIAGGVDVVRWTLRVNRGTDRSGSDLIDCIAMEPVLQQRALAWALGTPLTVEGAIRRRFFRTAGRTTTRVEVEVEQVTVLDAG